MSSIRFNHKQPIYHMRDGSSHCVNMRHFYVETMPVSQVDVIKWKHFPRYWPFVRGIQRSPGNSPHKGLWRGASMFSLICVWINGWVNNREAGDLRRSITSKVISTICTLHSPNPPKVLSQIYRRVKLVCLLPNITFSCLLSLKCYFIYC